MINLEHIALVFQEANQNSIKIVIKKTKELIIECLISKPTGLGLTGYFSVKERHEDGSESFKAAYKLSYNRQSYWSEQEYYTIEIDKRVTDNDTQDRIKKEWQAKKGEVDIETMITQIFKSQLQKLDNPEKYKPLIRLARLCNYKNHKMLAEGIVE
jgi:hypothetical protein